MRIVKVIPVKSPTTTITNLVAGDTFILGCHSLRAIQDGTQKFSIYMKMPSSKKSRGDLPNTTMVDRAIDEGRIALNLSKGICIAIGREDRLYRVDLDVNVSILV